jgi:hypothetical protein
MPYTTSVAGTTITASWANANVRDQVVTPFATTAARDSAITAPVAGMVAVTTDTNTVWTYSGTAWVQAAQNGAWTTWTPAITQSGAVSSTVTAAVYGRWGRMIVGHFRLSVTGTGTAANAVTVSLPVTSARSGVNVGSGNVYDTSVGSNYTGHVSLNSTTTFQFEPQGLGVTPSVLGVGGFTAALAAGDVVAGFFTYEAAS